MRDLFIKELIKLAKDDDRIVVLTGDLGFGVLEDFQKQFPNRFYNVGISEQNMIGVASGLAKDGFIPFCYSIAPFALLRPYEFIKNGPVLHSLKVRIVATGGGFEYGEAGYTHYCLEDVAITRVFPNLEAYFPINGKNASSMLRKTYDLNAPIYYRVGKNKVSLTDDLVVDFNESGIEVIRNESKDICVLCLSGSVEQGVKALSLSKDKSFDVYSITKVNPMNTYEIVELLKRYSGVVTVESAYKNGGLGSIISEVLQEYSLIKPLKKLAVYINPTLHVGTQSYLEERYKIDSSAILLAVEDLKNGNK